MMNKKILRPDRLRQVPAQFSWVDQRLVRDNFLRHADPAAWALYLALVTVADQTLTARSGGWKLSTALLNIGEAYSSSSCGRCRRPTLRA